MPRLRESTQDMKRSWGIKKYTQGHLLRTTNQIDHVCIGKKLRRSPSKEKLTTTSWGLDKIKTKKTLHRTDITKIVLQHMTFERPVQIGRV